MDKKINEIIKNKKDFTISFEVFPPQKSKDENLELIFDTIKKLKTQNPDFISVTFGTGGKNKNRAVKIAEFIEKQKIVALSHLTCLGYKKTEVKNILDELNDKGVSNILALRGDIPNNDIKLIEESEFKYSKDLIKQIKSDNRFCIGAAVYPEGHTECKNLNSNVEFTRQKINEGADFFISQLFFDNKSLYKFQELLAKQNLEPIILPGIMPVLRANQINRIIDLTGTVVPNSLRNILDKYSDNDLDMEKAGIEFAVNQINDLMKNGVKGIHLYTMNKAEQSIKILNSL